MLERRRTTALLAAIVVAVLAIAPAAHAFPVGPSGVLFDGAWFDLFYSPNTATSTPNDFYITAQITTTASPTFTDVDAINIKVASDTTKYAATPVLVSAPNTGWTTPVFDVISNGGSLCGGTSPSGFVCSTGTTNVAASTTYDWTFLVTLNNVADLLTGTSAAGFRAYLTTNGSFLTIFSPRGTTLEPLPPTPLIPEPATLILFGTGLMLVTLRRIRRR